MKPGARVLVTGASGLVGHAVVLRGAELGIAMRGATRRPVHGLPLGVELALSPELAPGADWAAVLTGVDVLVHCAARVHVMRETATDPLASFRRVNAVASLDLARQAVNAGVRRMVFISTIFVNGTETRERPFRADDEIAPTSPYAQSKSEAESGLRELASLSGLELVVVRPPLVYGPGVRGNFERLLQFVNRGVPLPLGAIHNRRSLVGIDNLVDLILTCARHPAAAGETFLVSDGTDLSTTELLRRTAQALGCPSRLLPVPERLLRGVALLTGKRDVAQRLLGSLQVDIGKTRELLDWQPPVSVDEGLLRTARAFLRQAQADRQQ